MRCYVCVCVLALSVNMRTVYERMERWEEESSAFLRKQWVENKDDSCYIFVCVYSMNIEENPI